MTLDQELRAVWLQRLNFVRAVFLVNRWGPSMAVIFVAYGNVLHSYYILPKKCLTIP